MQTPQDAGTKPQFQRKKTSSQLYHDRTNELRELEKKGELTKAQKEELARVVQMEQWKKEQFMARLPQYLANSGIRGRLLLADIADFPDKYRHLHTTLVQGELRNGLYLHGDVGVGKTHLMGAVLKQVLVARQIWKPCCYFIRVPHLLLALRDVAGGHSETTEKAIIDKYSEIPILFLDDLGVNKLSEWVEQCLFLIIEQRSYLMLPTVITSNFSPEQLARNMSDRIVSRIAGICAVHKITGKDRRLLEVAE